MTTIVSFVLNNFKNDSRVLKESISLKKVGYHVEVIALHEAPLLVREEINGVPVHRIRLKSRAWPKRLFFQFLKYLEFIFLVVRFYRNRDCFHCNDLGTLPIGVFIKCFFNRKAKIVYDAHEYETELNGLSKLEKWIRFASERFLIKYADKVLTVSDSIANEYAKLYKIEKPTLVLNCPPFSNFNRQDLFRQRLGIKKDQTIFLYQGGLNKGRGIETILKAFSQLDPEKYVVVLMGYGPQERMVLEAMKQHKNIFFFPAVPPDSLLNFTSSADFGILFYEDNCLNHRYCSPNKLFEYIMARIPIISSKLPEIENIIRKLKIGIVAHENTVNGLVEALRVSQNIDYHLTFENLSKARHRYCWEIQEQSLLRDYKDLFPY